MSAGMYENDWMMSANGIRPWHGIGTVVTEAPTSAEAIKLAKLNWDVVQFPISANGKEIPNHFANVRMDTNEALGVVKARYKIVQNNDAFSFVDDIINDKDIECHYETAGSLFNGRKIFLLVKLPNQTVLDDEIENYLFFTNSHDGSSTLTAGISNVRVVCNNTLQLAMDTAKRIWNIRHTSSLENKVDLAKESLGLAVNYIDNIKTTADKMFAKKIAEEEFFKKLFDAKYITNISEKNKEQMITRMHYLYNEKPDLANFKGTAWGMYNAVADYCSNSEPFRKTDKFAETRLNKFFDGDYLLATAQNILAA